MRKRYAPTEYARKLEKCNNLYEYKANKNRHKNEWLQISKIIYPKRPTPSNCLIQVFSVPTLLLLLNTSDIHPKLEIKNSTLSK